MYRVRYDLSATSATCLKPVYSKILFGLVMSAYNSLHNNTKLYKKWCQVQASGLECFWHRLYIHYLLKSENFWDAKSQVLARGLQGLWHRLYIHLLWTSETERRLFPIRPLTQNVLWTVQSVVHMVMYVKKKSKIWVISTNPMNALTIENVWWDYYTSAIL